MNTCSVGIAASLPHKLTLIHISRSSFSLPTDVILKMPGGSIDAHKSILAAVSTVFEQLFYGNAKEGKSMAIDLPKDNYNTMNLLIDFVYRGSCELKNLDDIFPILEAFDRYQINKNPFYHMCGEIIVAKLDSSNYLTLLPKFSSVMSEEGTRKAAKRVMQYTNNDFIAKFDGTKDLPEEVLLQLLQMDITDHEVDVFDFLVKWHDYQTKDLGKSLRLTYKLFQCVRYSLIIPQILTSRVMPRTDLVDRQQLIDAYYYIYNSCKPLGEYNSNECTQEPIGPSLRKPKCLMNIEWVDCTGTMQHDKLDEYRVSNGYCNQYSYIIKSPPLRNGTYVFSVLSITATVNYQRAISGPSVSVAVSNQNNEYLYFHPLFNDSQITVYVHDEYLFLKLIIGDKVKSTASIMLETGLCSIYICGMLSNHHNYSFCIHNHVR